mmetsp:Transcript_27134/g.88689  ORF Transcript_27134/g.88689 Transcript_27134/m.88689 type:complete len:251 (-) Transcript_27134:45-797(-)
MMPSPSFPRPLPCTYPILLMMRLATPLVPLSHAPNALSPLMAAGIEKISNSCSLPLACDETEENCPAVLLLCSDMSSPLLSSASDLLLSLPYPASASSLPSLLRSSFFLSSSSSCFLLFLSASEIRSSPSSCLYMRTGFLCTIISLLRSSGSNFPPDAKCLLRSCSFALRDASDDSFSGRGFFLSQASLLNMSSSLLTTSSCSFGSASSIQILSALAFSSSFTVSLRRLIASRRFSFNSSKSSEGGKRET